MMPNLTTYESRVNYLKNGQTLPGWLPILLKLNDDLTAIDPDYRIVQVKEKFGGLRYYIESVSKMAELEAVVRVAEAEAARTCELCGSRANVSTAPSSTTYWVKTFCDTCREENDNA